MKVQPGSNGWDSVKLISLFEELFVNRKDLYALQQDDGGYLKVEEELTSQVLLNHLKGKVTVGVYQLNKENNVRWLCFDLDPGTLEDAKEAAQRIIRECVYQPSPDKPRFHRSSVLLEASRHPDLSFHIWALFQPIPIPAKAARWLGLKILEHANSDPKKVEVFPKQTKLTESRPYGNLVKAPLGFHRAAKKWSQFLDLDKMTPIPSSCLFQVKGVSFLDRELARICEFEEKTHIQIKFDLPENYKPLKDKEENRIVQFLLKYWKPERRNQLEMAFLGWCLKKGVSFKSAYRIVDQVAKMTNDEEREQRLQLVRYHYENRKELASELLGISGLREVVEEALTR